MTPSNNLLSVLECFYSLILNNLILFCCCCCSCMRPNVFVTAWWLLARVVLERLSVLIFLWRPWLSVVRPTKSFVWTPRYWINSELFLCFQLCRSWYLSYFAVMLCSVGKSVSPILERFGKASKRRRVQTIFHRRVFCLLMTGVCCNEAFRNL